MHSTPLRSVSKTTYLTSSTLILFLSLQLIAVRLANSQTATVLYSFTGSPDGANPGSRLTNDGAGNFYGTTGYGGIFNFGTVFELSRNGNLGWKETVLYSFTGGADGGYPNLANVIFDGKGNLYGTASKGGANGYGVVYELSPGSNWTETVLYNFTGGADGADPTNGLVFDQAGNLYGGNSSGVFELSNAGGVWALQVISDIGSGALSIDGKGNIFGTTGTSIFELSPQVGGVWKSAVLHTLDDNTYANGPLAIDQQGNLYGEIIGTPGLHPPRHSNVFKLSPLKHGWIERPIYSFYEQPLVEGGLVLDSAGNIYGTAAISPYSSYGVVFGLTAPGGLLWEFNGPNGALPYAGVSLDRAGNLYGTTYGGGSTGNGVVFEYAFKFDTVTLVPANLYYSNLPVGKTSAPQISILTNVGSTSLAITSIGVTGPDNNDFAETNNCGMSLPVGDSCSISVAFTPTAYGNRSAQVSIADNASDSPQSLSLTGFGQADTSTELVSSPNPSKLGKPVTFTATVSGGPTGYVSFIDGTTTLATEQLKGGTGTATFKTTELPLGLNVITASYSGDSNDGPSVSAPLNQYVQVPTAVTLTSSLNPSVYGEAVTFAAVVTSSSGAPPNGETVSFMNGGTVLGTGTIASGQAALTTSILPVGKNSITAVYAGDAALEGSTSKALNQIVDAQGPYGVVSPTSLNFGQVAVGQTSPAQLVSLSNTGTAELTVSDVSVTTNYAITVNHCENGVKPGTHCNVYVTFTPQATGTETGTLTFTDNASNGPQTVSLTGMGTNVVATATMLTSAPNPSFRGQAVTLAANVMPAPPDGEVVTFIKGKTSMGTGTLSGGSALFVTSTLKSGTTSVTAAYGGDQNFGSSTSNSVKQVVEKAGQ